MIAVSLFNRSIIIKKLDYYLYYKIIIYIYRTYIVTKKMKIESISIGRFILASIISSAMAFNGYKKRSLKSGCAAAVIVGFI